MLAGLVTSTAAPAQDLTSVRAAVLQIGTVNWELSTIIDKGLDEKYGFELEMQPYADNGATRVAVEGGEADIAVADWIWVARQRAAGKDYVFIPYSKAVGGVVVPDDSPAETLKDLAGGQDRHRGRAARQELADPARLREAGIRHGSQGRDRAGLWRAAADLQIRHFGRDWTARSITGTSWPR